MKILIAKFVGVIINIIGVFSPKTAAQLSVKIFSTPKRKRFKELERDFLGTAFTEDIKFDDIEIMTYRWLGKKDTILLAHGWESNAFRWRALIEKLNRLDYNVIAIDAPAHGRSGGKVFNAILYSECINVVVKKFKVNVIIGHSVGGMATTFFQHKYQIPSVEKLVLLGAPSNFVGVFSRYVKLMGYSKGVARAMDNLVYERFNERPDFFNAARFAEFITAEGLVIHDKYDNVIPYSDAEDFRNFYKNAKLIITEGFGHSLKDETINEHIIDFVNN